MNEDPDLARKRATHAAKVAANELPPPIALKRIRILRWNGEAPAPQVNTLDNARRVRHSRLHPR
jgi:hypothetical protein